MKCPKCGKDMTLGKINLFGGLTNTAVPFWAEKRYFTQVTFPNGRDAEKRGVGFRFPAPREKVDVAFSNLPDGYACKECKVIVLDCGESNP
ncbi:MAG: hypothetical protein II916_05195 [Oscillospiraceae bacterium]|nr:hypothetical protein [Oscillospiraceae bacterium]